MTRRRHVMLRERGSVRGLPRDPRFPLHVTAADAERLEYVPPKANRITAQLETLPLIQLPQCDNRKPKCTPCLSSNQECNFPISRIVRGINIEDLPYAGQKYQCLLTVLELIRVAEGDELEDLLRQIRSARSTDDFLDSVQEAALLLPLNAKSRTSECSQGGG